MPTLLQIDSCLGVGSTGRIAEGIAAAAMARGWDCYMVHGARYVGKSIQKSYQVGSVLSEKIHYLLGLVFDNHGLNSIIPTKRIISAIRNIKPDLVQLHCVHGYYLNYKILFDFLKTTNIPVVWTFHDCWAFTGHCSHFASVNCNKWKVICYDCPLKNHYPKSVVFDNSKRNFQIKRDLFTSVKKLSIVCVSKWLSEVVSNSFFCYNERRVIYNGVDRNVFHYRDSNLRNIYGLDNKFVLMAVATAWGSGKGWDDYMKLAGLIDNDTMLVMIGLTDDQKKGLPPKVIGLGRTDNATQLAEFYSMADIVLNLSYYETFGLTTVEGMACGTPSIVYNNTASPELVDDYTGFVVEPRDVNGVLKAILTIKERGKQFYSEACVNRVKRLFDQNDRYNEYIDLYERQLQHY